MKKISMFLPLFFILNPSLFAQNLTTIQAGTYTITNKNSNLCLAIRSATSNNGEEATQWTCDGYADKNWKTIDAGGGYYKIQNANSNLYLAVGAGSRVNGGRVIQWVDEGQQDIYWGFMDVGSGYYKIQNKNSGLFLAVGAGSREGAADLVQWADEGQEDIKWKIINRRVMTRFNPVVHGFKFVNDFQVEVRIAQINGPRFAGQCGGMAYTALDYFKSGQTIPSQNYRPANGTTLQAYIHARQLNSLGDNADKWIELFVNPFGRRTTEFFNWGVQGFNGGRLQELREAIDSGNPIPLGLFKGGNGGVGPHHQVLAIGYDMGRYTGDLGNFKEDLKIFIYDPNHPNEMVTLRPNPGSYTYSYEQYPNEAWMAYFVDRRYSARTPPVIPTVNLPNDGMVGELLLEICTGGDDLRGGNDNVNVIVRYTDGTSDTYPNINRSATWIGNYIETVPVSLRRTAPLNQIRSVSLITTFGGGLFGDNWNMDRLRIIARSGNSEREVYSMRGTPLVRFNGHNTPFEAVFTY